MSMAYEPRERAGSQTCFATQSPRFKEQVVKFALTVAMGRRQVRRYDDRIVKNYGWISDVKRSAFYQL